MKIVQYVITPSNNSALIVSKGFKTVQGFFQSKLPSNKFIFYKPVLNYLKGKFKFESLMT